MYVIKRTGAIVPFDKDRIFNAISGANSETGEMAENEISMATDAVVNDVEDYDSIGVEDIQDKVEYALMNMGFPDTAKAFIIYRQEHTKRREAASDLMEHAFNDLLFKDSADMDLKRDNANINTDGSMGIMLKLGAEGAKCFAKHYALPEKYAKPHIKDYYHIHDLDFSFITFNCCQIDLGKVLKGGFSTGHGFLREPNSIRAAASLACIVIQSNQNDQFGGQSINALDYALAPYVDKSFKKAFNKHLVDLFSYHTGISYDDMTKMEVPKIILHSRYGIFEEDSFNKDCESFLSFAKAFDWNIENVFSDVRWSWIKACRDVEEETKQAMEAMIHNFNTLHSRAGAQVPFSSINYGMDTSPEGRLVIDKTLDAIWEGLGNGETAIFPISVFQLKAGVNYNPGDPNYDLFQKACKVSAKRLFPNFVNIDAPYNLQYYKPGNPNSVVATMG